MRWEKSSSGAGADAEGCGCDGVRTCVCAAGVRDAAESAGEVFHGCSSCTPAPCVPSVWADLSVRVSPSVCVSPFVWAVPSVCVAPSFWAVPSVRADLSVWAVLSSWSGAAEAFSLSGEAGGGRRLFNGRDESYASCTHFVEVFSVQQLPCRSVAEFFQPGHALVDEGSVRIRNRS